MKLKTTKINIIYFAEGIVLAILCGLIYYSAFFLQTMISPWVNYSQGVDLFFLPAGIKLIAFMIAGVWGLIGIAIVGLITSFDVWKSDSLMTNSGNILIWAGIPYTTYRYLVKMLYIDLELNSIKYRHVLFIALATSLTSSVGSSLYQYLISNRSLDMITSTSLAMAIGDFIGTGVCIFALTFAVRHGHTLGQVKTRIGQPPDDQI